MNVSSQRSWRSRIAELVRRVETLLLVVFLSGLMVLASAQILLRNVFSIGVTWGDGLARLAVLWLALLGALAASREGKHLRMELAARWLPPGGRRVVGLVVDLFAATVSGLLAWYSLAFVIDSREYGDIVLGGVPAWWFQAIMPVAFALIGYRYVIHSLRRFKAP